MARCVCTVRWGKPYVHVGLSDNSSTAPQTRNPCFSYKLTCLLMRLVLARNIRTLRIHAHCTRAASMWACSIYILPRPKLQAQGVCAIIMISLEIYQA